MTTLLAVGLIAPFLGVACLWMPGLKVRPGAVATVCLVVAGAGVGAALLESSSGGWWAVDRVGALLAESSLFVGVCVCRYAVRQFDTERRGRLILAASLATVGAVVATDLAHTYAALVGSWIATSICTVLLLGVSTRGSRRKDTTALAARTFALVDAGLLIGATVLIGSPALTEPFGTLSATSSGWRAVVVIATASIAAIGRAGLTLRRSWVTATINAPTSTSALLHAGVVNGGAILLLRAHVVAGTVLVVDIVLAVLCVTVIAFLARRIHARADLKGQLAASTVSQMAFMLLTLALSLPLLAVTHLIGHGIYKAGRFMSAGGATQQRALLRRRGDRGTVVQFAPRLVGASALAALALVLGLGIGSDGLAIMSVFGPAAAATWWVRTRTPIRGASLVWSALGLTLATYAMIVLLVGRFVSDGLPNGGWGVPWWTLGFIVAVVSFLSARRRRSSVRAARTSDLTSVSRELAKVAA